MIYVMSDIHGDLKKYRSVMSKINLQAEDNLYILGDVIDRYPNGIEILFELMRMSNTTVLLGNHELMMSEVIKDEFQWNKVRKWYINGGMATHNAFRDLSRDRKEAISGFIEQMPLTAEVQVNGINYLLVHGIPPDLKDAIPNSAESEKEFATWMRITPEDIMPSGKIVIFGHTPTEYYQEGTPLRIWHGGDKIGIDCGCGNECPVCRLACLRLDDMAEFYSE